MSRYDRRRARRWSVAATAAAAGLAGWLLFFRGAGAAPDNATSKETPKVDVKAEPKPAAKPEPKSAPPAKKVEPVSVPKPVPVSLQPEPKQEPAPKPAGDAPWKYLIESGKHHE